METTRPPNATRDGQQPNDANDANANEHGEHSHATNGKGGGVDAEVRLQPHRSPQSEAVRQFVAPWLGGADTVMYVLIGIVFLGGALAMLVYSVLTFFQDAFIRPPENSSFADAVVTLINDLLLVMIIMEVLRTIGSYIEERGASLRPFLFIGAISATRRILAIGAEMSIHGDKLSPADFNRRLVDLCVNAGVILAIVIALYLLSHRAPTTDD